MADDTAKVMEALQYVRRHTANAQVLLVCDALSKHLFVKPVSGDIPAKTSRGDAPEPTSRENVHVTCPICAGECPVCSARKKAEAARSKKAYNRAGKGKRKGKAKPPLSPVIQTTNNAPAASPTGRPSVTHRQQYTPE